MSGSCRASPSYRRNSAHPCKLYRRSTHSARCTGRMAGGGAVLCPLCGINSIVRYRCGYGRSQPVKVYHCGSRSAGKCRGGGSAAQVAGYLIRKAGAADTVCVGNRKLLDRSVQNKALRLRRSSRFCRIISICNNFLMVVCKCDRYGSASATL